jgi:hypothetical protein
MQKATQFKITCSFTKPSVSNVLRRSFTVATFSQENRLTLFQ